MLNLLCKLLQISCLEKSRIDSCNKTNQPAKASPSSRAIVDKNTRILDKTVSILLYGVSYEYNRTLSILSLRTTLLILLQVWWLTNYRILEIFDLFWYSKHVKEQSAFIYDKADHKKRYVSTTICKGVNITIAPIFGIKVFSIAFHRITLYYSNRNFHCSSVETANTQVTRYK